jgi:hypothetical protein
MSLRARTVPAFKTRGKFKEAVKRHLTWAHRKPTTFVSTFADREHAINWATQRVNRCIFDDAVSVLTLDVDCLGPIFCVRDLVEDPGVKTKLPESMYQDEYLVLQEIHPESIRGKTIIPKAPRDKKSDKLKDASRIQAASCRLQ